MGNEASKQLEGRKLYPKRPVWMPDESTQSCTDCAVLFSFFTRRHHCRLCGLIFCDECCQWFRRMPAEFGYGVVRQRTCKSCCVSLLHGARSASNERYEPDAFVGKSKSASAKRYYTEDYTWAADKLPNRERTSEAKRRYQTADSALHFHASRHQDKIVSDDDDDTDDDKLVHSQVGKDRLPRSRSPP